MKAIFRARLTDDKTWSVEESRDAAEATERRALLASRAGVPPVQPTASRPRATVERLHRRPTNNPPLDASPPKGGGSTSARNKPATKPDAADDK